MATTTTNLGLVIPAMGDAPNINVVSQAFEGVDSFAGGVVAGSTDQYDSSATYAIGDLCIYNNTLYKCSTAISTPEAWDSTHWTQSSLANEVGALTDQIATLNTAIGRINNNNKQSIILPSNATSTSSTVNTYGSRKFSDYRQLLFAMYSSASDRAIIRDVVIIPQDMWVSGKTIHLVQQHGTSLENSSGIAIIYDSDTSVKVVTLGAGLLTGYEILGYIKLS